MEDVWNEIACFHPLLKPHFLSSPDEEMQLGRINVYAACDSPLLIVAPHGHPQDDLNTELLAWALVKETRAAAVINNRKYCKPKNSQLGIHEVVIENPREPNPRIMAVRQASALKCGITVDLNKWPDARRAAPDFFYPLMILSEFRNAHSEKLAIFIHGIADNNAHGLRNPDFVVGAGYELPFKAEAFVSGDITAREKVIDFFIEELKKLRINRLPVWVEEGLPGYAAAHKIRMPWVFKTCASQPTEIDAIQLEIRHKGLREPENIPRTARDLAKVFRRTVELSSAG
jgi:hypothetical protein